MKARVTSLLMALLALAAPASARLWKPTPQQLAADYTTITHNKGGTAGRVLLQWIAAPAMTGNLQQVMEKYVVLNIIHTVVAPGGLTEWQDIEGVAVTDAAGEALKEVPSDAIPPLLVSLSPRTTPRCGKAPRARRRARYWCSRRARFMPAPRAAWW